jgi:hypothetical protein
MIRTLGINVKHHIGENIMLQGWVHPALDSFGLTGV